MIKEKFKEIVKTGIHPSLKEAGFKKKGNHFIKKLKETQQVVTLQLSHGNCHDQLRFYFRCGILINGMETEIRDLKSEVYADYRFGINSVTNQFENDYFNITNKTLIEPIAKNIEEVIKLDLIPFFNNHQTENQCIKFMTNQNSLQGDMDLIKYLCIKDNSVELEKYVIRLTKFLKSIKDHYNDEITARNSVDSYISLIEEFGKMDSDLKDKIEKSWFNE